MVEAESDTTRWYRVAALEEIGEDHPKAVTVDGLRVALYNLGGKIFATSNICPHQFALLSDGYLEDGVIECPLHQARFDVATGKHLSSPAEEDLRTYPILVEGDDVLVGVSKP